MNLSTTLHKRIPKQILEEITTFGGLLFQLFLILLFLSLEKYTLSLQLFIAGILSYTTIIIIRTFYYKERPQKQTHTNYIKKIDASSFPSMHATRTITYLILIPLYFKSYHLSILFLIIYILVTYSRYALKKHYIIDLIGGTILGIIIATTIYLF